MPKKQLQKNKSNISKIQENFEIIGGAENAGGVRGLYRTNSMPDLQRSDSNELNLNVSQINEAAHEEAEHKAKAHSKGAAVKDQNGPLPNQEEAPEEAPQVIPVQQDGQESIPGEEPQPDAPNAANPFVAQQTERSKWSNFSKGANGFWRFMGNSIGKASVLPLTVAGKALLITPGIKHAAHKKAEKGQQSRNHRVIPGRDGETFDPEKDSGEDILADFRRVPTVWSYLTAGEATDANGEDLDPKVSVYVSQPKSGSSRSMEHGKIGHAMIGIEYTRYSRITQKKERYNIRYGFYPAGSTMSTIAGATTMLKGAVVPGQLNDDAGHDYDISKTYPAKKDQIEKIAKASETYTEKGGYGFYTRNCTTFVRDMFKEGGIATNAIDTIFTNEAVRFDKRANTGFVFANAWNGLLDTSMQKHLGELTESNDRSYQGWGNKRVTAEDFDRYRATKNTAGYGIKSLAPASAGENMRRMTDSEGQLSSFKYVPDSLKDGNEKAVASDVKTTNFYDIFQAVQNLAEKLNEHINEIMTGEQAEVLGMDFIEWVGSLFNLGYAFSHLNDAISKAKDKIPEGKRDSISAVSLVDPKVMKNTHAEISAEMALISKMYQTKLHSDSRLNEDIMNLLSVMQLGLLYVDRTYAQVEKAADTDALGKIREKSYVQSSKYTVKVGSVEVEMTPTHYESYLQIYKTPEAAVKAYKRFLEMQNERTEHGEPKKSKGKKLAEWSLLERNEELAKQLDQSHRDMLNKNAFTQGDIDYAFRLRRKEINSGAAKATGSMYTETASASTTYMALFFDKIFGGIQNTAKADQKAGGMPDTQNVSKSARWLNDYLEAKTKSKAQGMGMILRGIMRAYDRPRADYIKESLHHFLLKAYLKKLFPGGEEGNDKLKVFGSNLDNIYAKIRDNPNMSFTKLIDNLTNVIMTGEQGDAQLKKMQRKTGQ